MAKYRRKPEEIEAIQWDGKNYDEIKDFAQDNINRYNGCLFLHVNGIRNSLDSQVVNQGDYIVKAPGRGFYSLDYQAFHTIYEEIN